MLGITPGRLRRLPEGVRSRAAEGVRFQTAPMALGSMSDGLLRGVHGGAARAAHPPSQATAFDGADPPV